MAIEIVDFPIKNGDLWDGTWINITHDGSMVLVY